MATSVLVHGAWHGGWCWQRVRSLLQEQGHVAFTPTLTGLCERSHLFSRSINLTTHVADIVNLIEWEGLEDIVLCGHSYAGMVITGVAERVPERIRSLVFLNAFVPADGQTLMSFSTPDALARRMAGAAALGGIAIPPTPAAAFNVNAADRDWVDHQCTPQRPWPLPWICTATHSHALGSRPSRSASGRRLSARSLRASAPGMSPKR